LARWPGDGSLTFRTEPKNASDRESESAAQPRRGGTLGPHSGRCSAASPGLCGFSLQTGPAADYIDTSSLRDELFVTELGFSAPVSETEYDEAYKLITEAVADIVSERPEALELLRGRTFARTLH